MIAFLLGFVANYVFVAAVVATAWSLECPESYWIGGFLDALHWPQYLAEALGE